MRRVSRSYTPTATVTNEQLVRLAQLVSGRLHLRCSRCQVTRRMTIEFGNFMIGNGPEQICVDGKWQNAPRLVLRCTSCNAPFGHIQGDEWTTSAEEADEEVPTRWNYLEFEEQVESPL